MGNYTGSPMTHSSMENDTTTSLDVSQLISQHSCVPSNYGVVFDSPKAVEIDVEEGTGSKPVIPTSRRRYKWTAKRFVKPTAIYKSPFVSQCLTQFPKVPIKKSWLLILH